MGLIGPWYKNSLTPDNPKHTWMKWKNIFIQNRLWTWILGSNSQNNELDWLGIIFL